MPKNIATVNHKRHRHAKSALRRKEKAKKQATSLVNLSMKVSQLAKRTRGGKYRFQLKNEQYGSITNDGTPFVIPLSDFATMSPIFQARNSAGGLNTYLTGINKFRALFSRINFALSIQNASVPIFTCTVFFVKLHRTAKPMLDAPPDYLVLNGRDLVPEKDICYTPADGQTNRGQICLLNRNVFKILYAKRFVLGWAISPVAPAGSVSPPMTVTNREDTTVDTSFKLIHNKDYKAAYGQGALLAGTVGAEEHQPIAGRPYMIVCPQKWNTLPNPGLMSCTVQQVCTLETQY